MLNLIKSRVHSAGRRYLQTVVRAEYESQKYKRQNERPIEYRFVFEAIVRTGPQTILDVGTGETALPSLMRTCGPVVRAVDNVRDYWPEGMINRHYHVDDEDAVKGLTGSYDMVTCISVLEHIKPHDAAVRSMLGALKPGGHLVLTCPYREEGYVGDVYRMAGAGYGADLPYVCQMYSRAEADRWFADDRIVTQEYWRVFSGEYWTFGETLRPAVPVTREERHQLTCLLIQKL
jgi:SAM-dependent methyltransferase